MKRNYQCRYENCAEIFDHNTKRKRHERKHAKNNEKLKPKEYVCKCCEPAWIFPTAQNLACHTYYMKNKKKFKCA